MIFSQQVSRPVPGVPVGAMKTYVVHIPVATHWRKASCAEIDCPHYLNGWITPVDRLTARDAHLARHSGRRYTTITFDEDVFTRAFDPGDYPADWTEQRMLHHHRNDQLIWAKGERALRFEPGQPCFRAAAHRVRVDRQEIYVVRGGDWRANPTSDLRRDLSSGHRHTRAIDWVEDCAEHQQRIADRIKAG